MRPDLGRDPIPTAESRCDRHSVSGKIAEICRSGALALELLLLTRTA